MRTSIRTAVMLSCAGLALTSQLGCSADAPDDDAGQSESALTQQIECGVLVVGGGLGGVAAAQELGARGVPVCLTEETNLLGGTYTAQGTPIDSLYNEMPASFLHLDDNVLDEYRARYPGAPRTGWFKPGDCYRRQCWEPSMAARAVEQRTLAGYPAVHVYKQHVPTRVTVSGGRVASVTFQRSGGALVEMRAQMTIDATDLGDLYPLANVGFRVGRDRVADFHEPAAYAVNGNDSGDTECVQRMTWVFALERTQDNPANLIPRPEGYDATRYGTPGAVFDIDRGINPNNPAVTWWNWRRYLAPVRPGDPTLGIPGAADITSVNMFGENDFAVNRAFCGALGCSPIRATRTEQQAVFQNARNHSLGMIYFLQHDARRPDGRMGYSNIRLRPDVMGTSDGLAAYPYIREGRRLRALRTVTQNDMLVQQGPTFPDSIGINRYQVDIKGCPPTKLTPQGEIAHPTPGDNAVFMEIPFGALVPETMNGLLAGTSKNMGVSHIANGSLRVHPAEWTVGRAAGAAAAIALEKGIEPRQIASSEANLRLLQQRLLTSQRSGSAVWLMDVPQSDRGWVATQMMAASGVIGGYVDHVQVGPNAFEDQRRHHPDVAMTRGQAALVATRELGITPVTVCRPSFVDVACDNFAYGAIQALAEAGILGGYADGTFRPGVEITRAQFSKIVYLADCRAHADLCLDPRRPPADPGFSDVAPGAWFYDFVAMNKAHGYYRNADAGGASFGPGVSVTRREASIWLYNHLRLRLSLE